jgi:hypothetical protein
MCYFSGMPVHRIPASAPTAAATTRIFPKRRCDNCCTFYPLTKPWRKFCKPLCKKEFHQHGSAFGPLKERIAKLIRKEVAAQLTAALDVEALA